MLFKMLLLMLCYCHKHMTLGQDSIYDEKTQSSLFNNMLNTELASNF